MKDSWLRFRRDYDFAETAIFKRV